MALKILAFIVVALGVSVTYLHEYHNEKIVFLSNIPVIKSSFVFLHNFIRQVSQRLPFSKTHSKPEESSEQLFTYEEISKFVGTDGTPSIYLSILGKVYDVSKGKKHYGPGGSYHAFAGRDASRAFVTGDFSEKGLTDDVIGLAPADLKSIQDWSLFYHQEYIFKGKLVGRYYSPDGKPTKYHDEVNTLIKQAIEESAATNADFLKYPPCNVEWTPETGSKVWCSNRSGGIERDWEGVPRKYYKPGSASHRCACIKVTSELEQFPPKQRKGNLEEYDGCSPISNECYVRD